MALEAPLSDSLERERALLELLEDAPVAMHWAGADGRILWANRAELDLMGYRQDEYVGRRLAEFHENQDHINGLFERLLQGETLQNQEARVIRKDGRVRDILISSNGVWGHGKFIHSRSFNRDITGWKQAQNALHEAHETLTSLVQASPAPIVASRPDGNITIWNRAAEDLFGWSAEEVLGGPPPFVPAGKMDEHWSMHGRALEGKGATEYEVVRRHKEGSALELRVSMVTLVDSNGVVTALMSVYVDVTQAKRAQQRLQSQYGVARTLAEAVSIGEAGAQVLRTLCHDLGWAAGLLWQVDVEARALRCVATWAEHSMEAAALAGMHVDHTFATGVGLPGRVWATGSPAWISDVRLDHNFRRQAAAQAAGLRSGFGFPILSAGAISGVMEFFSETVQSPDQDLLGIVSCVGYQIGSFFERHRVRNELMNSEASYRALTETASDAIVAINGESTILFANSATASMFGYSAEELRGADLTLLMPEHLKQVHKAGILRYQGTGKRHFSWHAVTLPGQHRDGHLIPLEISFAEYQQNGRHVFIGIMRDVTERQQFNEKLIQTAKLESMRVLTGGIAHDFNNLLTGILGNASLALDMVPETHPAVAPLQDAIEASDRAAHLTRQLLAYAGKAHFTVRALDLSELARETLGLLKGSIPKHVTVSLNLAQRLPLVEGDAAQLQQAVINLVINGAEAIEQGKKGTVLVTTASQELDQSYLDQTFGQNALKPGSYVTLEVRDTGAGMDEATTAKIFDPFFTTKFTGRGLGLAAVLGIVQAHKGALKVYSRPGQGTTFQVLFPPAGVPRE